MQNISDTDNPLSADQIADLADAGEDISRFFTNAGHMVQPANTERVVIEFAPDLLHELDRTAQELHVSRQAAIQRLLRQSLDARPPVLAQQAG